jgi:hypothetical protein
MKVAQRGREISEAKHIEEFDTLGNKTPKQPNKSPQPMRISDFTIDKPLYRPRGAGNK